MLPITLEPQTQINLFSKPKSAGLYYELEVVNQGSFAEIKLYYLASDFSAKKERSKKNKPIKTKEVYFEKYSEEPAINVNLAFG
ncbi:MAG: hypothetical protein HYS25_03575 [Ignavibacteriales bacterium]|nr:hypothetical protein [Ignavibacteriales bacterium]